MLTPLLRAGLGMRPPVLVLQVALERALAALPRVSVSPRGTLLPGTSLSMAGPYAYKSQPRRQALRTACPWSPRATRRQWSPRAPLLPATPFRFPRPRASPRRRAPLRVPALHPQAPPAARVAHRAAAPPAAVRRNLHLVGAAVAGDRGAAPRVVAVALVRKGPAEHQKAALRLPLPVAPPRRPPVPSEPSSTKSAVSSNTPCTAFSAIPSASPRQLPPPLCAPRVRLIAACVTRIRLWVLSRLLVLRRP